MCKESNPDLIRSRCRDLIGPSSLVYSFIHMCLEQLLHGAHAASPPPQHTLTVSSLRLQSASQPPASSPPPPNPQQPTASSYTGENKSSASPHRGAGSANVTKLMARASPNIVRSPQEKASFLKPPPVMNNSNSSIIASPVPLAEIFAKARKHETTERRHR